MPKSLTTFYRAPIKNNCPECFSTSGLELLFKQEWEDSSLYKKATDNITEVLQCHHCKAQIYPVNWTEDIERVYAYHLKLAEKDRYFKLKPLALGLIALGLLIVAGGVYMLLQS